MSDQKQGKPTPGPWKAEKSLVYALGEDGTNRMSAWVHIHPQPEHKSSDDAGWEMVRTAELMAQAPELLAEVERLRNERDELREAVRQVVQRPDGLPTQVLNQLMQALQSGQGTSVRESHGE